MTIRFFLGTAISALLAVVPLIASAQDDASDIRPHFGYYYWDIVSYSGEESYQVQGAGVSRSIADVRGRRPTIDIRGSRVEYMYDFCGKTNHLIGLAAEKSRRNADPFTGAPINDNDFETNSLTLFYGQHFSAGDFADVFLRVGTIQTEGWFIERFGQEWEQRSMFELGFRSRVGDRRNIELVQKTRYDEFYRLQFETGFLYHSAAGFSMGISYEIKTDAEYDEPGASPFELLQPVLQNQDAVSFTLRFNI